MSSDRRADPPAAALEALAALEGVPSAYAAARDGIDVMLRDRGLRRTSPETTAESLLRGAHASGVLEGSASTLAEVRAGEGDAIATDAVRVSAMLLSVVPTLRQAPLQALARVHAVAAGASLPEDRLGRPRDAESAQRLRGVADLLTARTSAPALLVAAVVHAELATSTPFASHNGIVARAAERLVLVARGVDEKSLVVPEAGHLALRAAYESNLRGYADGGRAGVHAWVLYAAEAYAAGAEASPLRRAAE
ncbi:Fic family protein [Nocardioides ochotonae]|uniref:oxidoreductase n=1 Tax=Nocardioides ochotonae TaxID=2685869 RepID=UPI001409BD96|nr:oxidoreductase [Nocardioides ochotonae]